MAAAAAEDDPFAALDDIQVESYNGEGYPLVAGSYQLTAMLGSGAYADVYRARCLKADGSSEDVAVKILDLQGYQGSIKTLTNEVHLLKLVNHENLLSILASFVVESELWIVTPLLRGGSCRQLMEAVAPAGFEDEKIIAKVMHHALEGIAYLHKNNMIHRDLKAGNMLISETGCIKVADFGASARMLMGGAEQTPQTLIGTPCWMAPEVVQQASGYSLKADIWSLGITALELAFGTPPYAQEEAVKIMLNILLQDPPTPETFADQARASRCSKLFRAFVARCLQKDPSKRPTAQELLKDKFIKQVIGKKFDIYLKDNIPWQQLPEDYLGGNQTTPLVRQKVHAKKETAAYVTVGSWAFASQDLDGAFEDDIIAGKQARQQSLAADRAQLQQVLQQPSAGSLPQPPQHPNPYPQQQQQQQQLLQQQQQPPLPSPLPPAFPGQVAAEEKQSHPVSPQPQPQPQPPQSPSIIPVHGAIAHPGMPPQAQAYPHPQPPVVVQPPPVAMVAPAPQAAQLPSAGAAPAAAAPTAGEPTVFSNGAVSPPSAVSTPFEAEDGSAKRKKKESRFVVTREP